jgi:hypothetical protein
MTFALPAELAGGLTDREAIADALYRAALAFDLNDEALLRSAVTDDVSVEGPRSSTNGVDELKAVIFDRVSKVDTTHILTNMRINIKDRNTAKVTCSALAQHVRPGKGFEPSAGKLTSGGMYLCDVVKVGGLWKIKTWKTNITWIDGDRSLFSAQETGADGTKEE